MTLYLVAIGFCSLITLIFGAYKIIRRRHYPATVNCWFCGENSEVPWSQINSWDCPRCDQYNGFTKDGDFNKHIPAQFCEELNVTPVSKSRSNAANTSSNTSQTVNILCENCTQNQFLKIRQLANFIPSSEENFNIEVDAYSHHLEQVYRLCHVCDSSVRRELMRQDAEIQAKISDSGAFSLSSRANDDSTLTDLNQSNVTTQLKNSAVRVFCALSTVCSFALVSAGLYVASMSLTLHLPSFVNSFLEMLSDCSVPLLVIGTFAEICAVFMSGLVRLRALNAFSCFCWLMMMLLFLLLEDSHVYSLRLVCTRLCLSVLNFVLTVLSVRMIKCSGTRMLGTMSRISPTVRLTRDHLNGFSKPRIHTNFDDEDSVNHENSKEFVDVPCVGLKRLRLGVPTPKEKSTNPYKVFGGSTLIGVAENVLMVDQHKNGVSRQYPLLSPPKFCPSGGLRSASPRSQLQTSVFSSNLWSGSTLQYRTSSNTAKGASDMMQFSRETLIHRQQSPSPASDTESNNSNFTTASQIQSSVVSGLVLKIFLAVSLIINIIAVVYLLSKFQTNIISFDFIRTYFRSWLSS